MTGLEFDRVQSDDPDVAVVALRGEIDLTNASDVVERLEEFAGVAMLILDLNGVSFVDSAALHRLFGIARGRGGGYRLVLVLDPASPISTTFRIVQLERAAPIVPALEDAISLVNTR